jgi:hypothetical protein
MDVAQGNIGQVGQYEIDFVGGKAIVKAEAGNEIGKISLQGELDAKIVGYKFLDWLKVKIPGEIDDAVIEVIKKGMEKL